MEPGGCANLYTCPKIKLVDHGYGLLDVTLASYNHLIRYELPRMINEMRPIVWSEKGADGRALSVMVQMKFASVQKPMLTESHPDWLLHMHRASLLQTTNNVAIASTTIRPRAVYNKHSGSALHRDFHYCECLCLIIQP